VAVCVIDEQDRPVDTDDLAALARHVLEHEQVSGGVELSLLLVDEATITQLNGQYMGKDVPTDVLAFPIDEPDESFGEVPTVLGDVVLCPEVAAQRAPALGRRPDDEIRLLTVHGILHLLGMDHAEPDDEQAMFQRTDELLASFASMRGGVA